jgi:hypothetical protein
MLCQMLCQMLCVSSWWKQNIATDDDAGLPVRVIFLIMPIALRVSGVVQVAI